jgi:hypothetical protein
LIPHLSADTACPARVNARLKGRGNHCVSIEVETSDVAGLQDDCADTNIKTNVIYHVIIAMSSELLALAGALVKTRGEGKRRVKAAV